MLNFDTLITFTINKTIPHQITENIVRFIEIMGERVGFEVSQTIVY